MADFIGRDMTALDTAGHAGHHLFRALLAAIGSPSAIAEAVDRATPRTRQFRRVPGDEAAVARLTAVKADFTAAALDILMGAYERGETVPNVAQLATRDMLVRNLVEAFLLAPDVYDRPAFFEPCREPPASCRLATRFQSDPDSFEWSPDMDEAPAALGLDEVREQLQPKTIVTAFALMQMSGVVVPPIMATVMGAILVDGRL